MNTDRKTGMLVGCGLGDALGAPYEFRQVKLENYTSEITYPLIIFRRFQGGKKIGALGQITDDTEMMLSLYTATKDGVYDREQVLKAYLQWANSKCPFMGKNTRNLFQGVKTIKGYEKRVLKSESHLSQSNGCLMRCCPLALLENWREAVEIDVSLSNPNQVCLESVRAYVSALRELLQGKTRMDALEKALEETELDEVRDAILTGVEGDDRDVKDKKGWILHALYCAFYALFSDNCRLDDIVKKGGDTDTNAAIAGALIGAYYGLDKMKSNKTTARNIDILLSADCSETEIPRPWEYSNRKLSEIVNNLFSV